MNKLRFEYYQDASGEWRWRLVARNGRIVADSGEGYSSKAKCLRAINKLRDSFIEIFLAEVAEV